METFVSKKQTGTTMLVVVGENLTNYPDISERSYVKTCTSLANKDGRGIHRTREVQK